MKAVLSNNTKLLPSSSTNETSYILTSRAQGLLSNNSEQTNIYWTWQFEKNSYFYNGINDYTYKTLTNDLQNLGSDWSLIFGIKSIQNGGINSYWIEKRAFRVIILIFK